MGKKQAEEIATRALLLGAKWDKAASMLVRTTHSSNGPGMIPSYWEEFFDVNGNSLTQREASIRRKKANQKLLSKRATNFRASFSKSIISDKMMEEFRRAKMVDDAFNNHMADSMKYMVDSAAFSDTMKIMTTTGIVTTEIKA